MAELLLEPPEAVQVRVLSLGDLELGEWWVRSDLRRDFWRLYRHDREGAALRLAGRAHALPAGRLVVVPPSLDFEPWVGAPVRQFFVHFDLLGWPDCILRNTLARPTALAPDPARDSLLDRIATEFASAEEAGPALMCRVRSLIQLAIAELIDGLPLEAQRRLGLAAGEQRELLPVLRYIEEALELPLANRELAAMVHMSESSFIRRFRRTMGQTPARYIRERRVHRAAELLALSDASIDDIAVRCGFPNRFYFSRVFAQTMGRPPARFRNPLLSLPSSA